MILTEDEKSSVFFMPEFKREQILGKPMFCTVSERAETVDAEKRIIKLSFSSDKPIEHWFGTVTLSHADGCADLERLNTAAPFLRNHDRNQRLGKIKKAWLENGKGYAEIQISNNALGNDFWRDYQDDCLIGTSFGFFINSFDDALSDYKNNQYTTTDWTPFEITDESIPADISVGVGRSLLNRGEDKICADCGGESCNVCGECADCETCTCETKRNSNFSKTAPKTRENSTTENNEKMADKNENPAASAETTEQARAAAPIAQSAEVNRAAEFVAIGEAFGEVELARDYALMEGKTIADFKRAIAEKRQKAQATVPPASPESVAERNGGQIELAHSTYRGGALKSFKGQNAQRDAYRSGMAFLALFNQDEKAIKYCREQGIVYNRTQTGKNNAQGGVFVIPEFENAIIDLRVLYGVARRVLNVTPMNSDTKIIHRRTGGLTAYPVGPGARGTQSTATWDDIELVARKWMVLAKMEDELEEDSVISFADTLASEISYAFTYAEDNAWINGDGSSTYHGIVGMLAKLAAATASLKTASGNAWSEITKDDLLGVVGLLPQFARKSGNVKWYCSSEFWANVLERIATAAGGVTHAEIEGELKEVFFGKPVEIVETMPHTEANSQIPLLYGNMSQSATLGDRRGVTVKMTDSNDTDFEQDLQSIKGTERFDINVHDVGNTSVAGPVVALITANS